MYLRCSKDVSQDCSGWTSIYWRGQGTETGTKINVVRKSGLTFRGVVLETMYRVIR